MCMFVCVCVSVCVTCHMPIVLLQLMDLLPLSPIFFVYVHLLVVGAQGNLWNTNTFQHVVCQQKKRRKLVKK